ncbi:uncharacterized protein AMSG_07705 [Thecamonas trahens ATCC 50062]|uniref:LIM zinc-binding domain-containing protein n=1 Tax=Thecamonas trahens ATCC 50062 TaxID=461836 RepID=A0A0L0DK02_THETB|nr:hypothetical protein AMSG_07705 [Thecamonas trahens ATCC 50062]KNC51643.1 hypothetical protein AMSG_07705 [Thecamonas trahens ATCC 50062]|eukprot:XP_013755783.1 hypothetical protein AMSG_07705 [Thecamonas trahens ATCC 50062]
MARPRKDTINLDSLMDAFAWDDGEMARATASSGTTNYVSAELSGPLPDKSKSVTTNVDLGGFDDALNSLMNGLSGLGGVVGEGLFKPCETCGLNVPEVDVIDLAGRFYHPQCAPVCPKCAEPVDPKQLVEKNSDAIAEINAKITKENKALNGMKAMKGLYPDGSREAKDVERQIHEAEGNVRRFEKRLAKLNDVGTGFVFVRQQFYHPQCFQCAVPNCTYEMVSDEFLDPNTGKPICRYHFFDMQGLICSVCDEPIDVLLNQQSVAVGDARFHSACFKCTRCRKPIKQFRKGPDTKIYCKECHTMVF